jgi:hypothetical protein
MLAELGNALAESVAESPRVNRAFQRLRDEGYSLYLVVRENSDEFIELRAAEGSESTGNPVFKIDGTDLSFLRSIGIDPTRKLRRRRW